MRRSWSIPRFDAVVAVAVAAAAALGAGLGLVALDANRQQSHAVAGIIVKSAELGQFANMRGLVDRYDERALQTVAALKAEAAARSATDIHDLAAATAEQLAAEDLQRQYAHSVGFRLDATGSARVKQQSAAFVKRLRAYGGELNALATRRTRYGKRGGRVTLALTLTAVAGAVAGLAGVLGATRSGWTVLTTGCLALVAAGTAAIWALSV